MDLQKLLDVPLETMAAHIERVVARGYVHRAANGRLGPTNLGLTLAEGFAAFAEQDNGAEGTGGSLVTPAHRAHTEERLARVAEGRATKEEFLGEFNGQMARQLSALIAAPEALDRAFERRIAGADPLGLPEEQATLQRKKLRKRTAAVTAADTATAKAAAARRTTSAVLLQKGVVKCGDCGEGLDLKAVLRGEGAGNGRAVSSYILQHTPQGGKKSSCPSSQSTLVIPASKTDTLASRKFAAAQDGYRCPACGTGVLKITNAKTRTSHHLCPRCFQSGGCSARPYTADDRTALEAAHAQRARSAPVGAAARQGPEHNGGGGGGMRCFQCPHPTCDLGVRKQQARRSVTEAARARATVVQEACPRCGIGRLELRESWCATLTIVWVPLSRQAGCSDGLLITKGNLQT
jgi:hypothetical protein